MISPSVEMNTGHANLLRTSSSVAFGCDDELSVGSAALGPSALGPCALGA